LKHPILGTKALEQVLNLIRVAIERRETNPLHGNALADRESPQADTEGKDNRLSARTDGGMKTKQGGSKT